MASYSVEIKFFTGIDEKTNIQKEICEYLKELNQKGNYYSECSEDNRIILNTSLENSRYPAFLDDLAVKFSDKIFIAYELYNEEGAGVPFYTLRYLIFKDGKVNVEDLDDACNEINELAESGDFESMEEKLSDITYDKMWQLRCEKLISGDTQDNVVYIADVDVPDYAYEDNSQITKVILPEWIKNIGTCAFAGCPNLRTIVFPNLETPVTCSGHMITDSFNLDSTTLSELDERFDSYDIWGLDCPEDEVYFIHKKLKEIFEKNKIPYNFSYYLEFTLFPDEDDSFEVELSEDSPESICDEIEKKIQEVGADIEKLRDYFSNFME